MHREIVLNAQIIEILVNSQIIEILVNALIIEIDVFAYLCLYGPSQLPGSCGWLTRALFSKC